MASATPARSAGLVAQPFLAVRSWIFIRGGSEKERNAPSQQRLCREQYAWPTRRLCGNVRNPLQSFLGYFVQDTAGSSRG
jgi:hypothetical protein